jgi:hypothetical protein
VIKQKDTTKKNKTKHPPNQTKNPKKSIGRDVQTDKKQTNKNSRFRTNRISVLV